MAINDDIMKQVSSFTNDAQLNDFFRNTGYSAEQLAAASGYNLGDIQVRMDAVRGTGGNPYDTGPVNDDSTQKIQADLARLNGGTEADLNAYLATTNYTPEQLAQVSGYNASDIAARMSQAYGGGSQGVRSYLQANPQVAKDYYGFGYSDKGYTLDEYAMQDWAKNGAKDGFGLSVNPQGFVQAAAPTSGLYETKFSEDQQKSIAQAYMKEMANTKDGPEAIRQAMQQYGVSPDDLAYAVSQYGKDFKTYGDQEVHQSYQIKNLFGGSRDQALFSAPTAEEQRAMDVHRAVTGAGKYNGSRNNVPGAILADMANSRATSGYTQEELEQARQNMRSGNYYFQAADGSYVNLLEDPNWQQTVQQKVAAEKAYTANQIRSGEGKVSPFVAGPQTGKNAPGGSIQDLAPGLTSNGIRATGTTAPAPSAAPAPGPAPAPKPFNGIVPTERLAEARRYGLDLNSLSQQELATFVNNGWAGLNQSRTAAWNQEAAARPANPNLMN